MQQDSIWWLLLLHDLIHLLELESRGCDISEQIIQELQLDQISESVSRDIIGLCADATAGLFYAYDQNSTFQKLDNLAKDDKCQSTVTSVWATELYLDKVCKCKILIVGMDYHISCLYLRGPMGSLLCISMWHAFHEQCLIAHLTSHTNKTQKQLTLLGEGTRKDLNGGIT
ncbi:vacuolar sorting protein 18 isoform X2 [Manihot esculenta]|uniref:Uncharacterized protein n=1 Tax=Manihot esculenta TaxID=3983 RepID=A0ACB7GMK6_MANES|nr:vacuolar sorting protein 18 isoform X2 [Manihot esculenta]KAG8641485.1 hypothetical protein MANES_13G151750v8 [Manihot esculenta]